jgi:hypothetical protein
VKSFRPFIARNIASAAVAVSLLAASAPVLSQPETPKDPAARQAQMHKRTQAHLQQMAKRLKISDAQQAAWTEYTRTVESLFDERPTPPPADADAVALTRLRADQAAKQAQKLTQLADATARLSEALTPEQRKILTEMVRREGRGEHARKSRPHGERSQTQPR